MNYSNIVLIFVNYVFQTPFGIHKREIIRKLKSDKPQENRESMGKESES